MRPLTLHVSALTETEYESYTKFLKDICDAEEVEPREYEDGTYYERVRVSAREARAWMWGRYARVGAASIDTILNFFAPDMRASDMLSGGQLLAALRMVVHADAGSDIHRGLAFIQASPVLDEHTASQGALSPSGTSAVPQSVVLSTVHPSVVTNDSGESVDSRKDKANNQENQTKTNLPNTVHNIKEEKVARKRASEKQDVSNDSEEEAENMRIKRLKSGHAPVNDSVIEEDTDTNIEYIKDSSIRSRGTKSQLGYTFNDVQDKSRQTIQEKPEQKECTSKKKSMAQPTLPESAKPRVTLDVERIEVDKEQVLVSTGKNMKDRITSTAMVADGKNDDGRKLARPCFRCRGKRPCIREDKYSESSTCEICKSHRQRCTIEKEPPTRTRIVKGRNGRNLKEGEGSRMRENQSVDGGDPNLRNVLLGLTHLAELISKGPN